MSIEDIIGVEGDLSKEDKETQKIDNAKNSSIFKEEKKKEEKKPADAAQVKKAVGFNLFNEFEKNAGVKIPDGDASSGWSKGQETPKREAPPKKRGRGRPPGSTSKKDKAVETQTQGNSVNDNRPAQSSWSSNDSRSYINSAFHSLEEDNKQKTKSDGRFDKRGALKKDVKWATETLINQRRDLSKEEKQKVLIANELNDLQLKFPHIQTRMGSMKNRKDISKTSLFDLQEELKQFRKQLSKPFQETIIEEVFFGAVKVFERIYMENVYSNPERDFLKVNIRGLHDALRGRKVELEPEFKELTCQFAPYLEIGPAPRLFAKTCKVASDVHTLNTCPNYAEVVDKNQHL